MRTKLISFILIAIVLLFSACSKAEDQSKTVRSAAPDFRLETIDGKTVVLSEILKDKKVVLDFWASWCPPCVRAIPELEEFYSENKDKVAVIGINVGESKKKVEEFVRRVKTSYPIVLDFKGSVANLYKVRGIPTLVFVNQDGKIIYYGHSIEEMARKVEFR